VSVIAYVLVVIPNWPQAATATSGCRSRRDPPTRANSKPSTPTTMSWSTADTTGPGRRPGSLSRNTACTQWD